MKLIIKNLGRVQHATIDVRPLTVFIGPNHTNKTWTAYALYGIACNLARIEFSTIRGQGFVPNEALQQAVNMAAERLYHTLTARPASAVKATLHRDQLIHGVASSDLTLSRNAEGIGAVLGVSKATVAGASADLCFSEAEFRHGVYSALEVEYRPSEFDLEWNFARADGSWQLHPYRVSLDNRRPANGPSDDVAQSLRRYLTHAVELLAYTILDDAAVLPSERKALVSLIDSQHSYSPVMDGRRTGMPAPVTDFLYMVGAAKSLRDAPGSRPEFPLELAGVLERQILRGKITFEVEDGRTGSVSRSRRSSREFAGSLSYVTSDHLDLPMHASASIVRSLAGLDIYLKEFCDRDGLLVIDEPEMNAHPEAQLKIIEFLAALVQNGVRVVLTTQSPYIVDHLSNLMQASRLGKEGKKAVASQFKLQMPEAFVSPDQVSVYLFKESGEVEDILDREQGIVDLTSFSSATEYMTNLVHKIWNASDEAAPDTVEQPNAV